MITIIKNITVYSPEYLGKKDVVIAGESFEGIYDNVNVPKDFLKCLVVDGSNKIMFPGFIDGHVHIIGGGGEQGFTTRTPEIKFTDITSAGITTVVGCLGTDNICRTLSILLAKAKELEELGITTYCYTGSYEIPVKTLTGRIKEDIMLIDKFIGVGEVALSDHRSSQPTFEEFIKVLSEARVGGLLSGKCGIVNVHMGAGRSGLEYILSAINDTEIPASQVLPTHLNRNTELFYEGVKYVKLGGYIDLTTSSNPEFLEPGEITASKGLKLYLDEDLPIEHITFTSDGNGSLAEFDKRGKEVGMGICDVRTLYGEVKKAIKEENIPIETAIKVITSNVADLLKLSGKGRIKKDNSADFVIVDEDSLDIIDVYAKGKCLVKDNKIIVKGVFEK